MTEEEKMIEQKLQPWRFWLYAALTAFLAVTFGLYLPLRFQHQNVENRMGHGDEMMGVGTLDHHNAARYHEEGEVSEGLAVNLNVTPVPVFVGTTTRLDFFVNQKPGNVPVTDLEIEHEKLMHVVGVRSDLDEFFHIHPVRSQTLEASAVPPVELTSNGVHPQPSAQELSGFFTTVHRFERPGLYKIWSQVTRGGVTHTFGHPVFDVGGSGSIPRKEISFGRSVIVGQYQTVLGYSEPIIKGVETELHFDIHDLFGREVEVEPFLDAEMHLAVIKDDLKHFIHSHPDSMEENHHGSIGIPVAFAHGGLEGQADAPVEDEEIHFRVTFPEAGFYKLFAQSRPRGMAFASDGDALTAAFWVRVEERAPLRVSQGVLAVISLIAIVILSVAVKKFLRVNE